MSEGFSPLALGAFELFFRPWMQRRLHALRFAGLPRDLPPDRPLLLVANHVSWWDPFVLREAQRLLRPGAPVYTVMLERELALRPFFRRIGAMGIDPGSPRSLLAAVRALRRRAAARRDAVVLFFPQGRIWPSSRRPLGFRQGIEVFAQQLAPATILPVALHVEPLNAAAPTAFAAAAPPREAATADAAELEHAVAEQLDRVRALLERHGEDAISAWPAAWEALPAAGGAARAETAG